MPVEVVKEVVHPIMDLITYNDQIALNRFDPQLMVRIAIVKGVNTSVQSG